MLRRMTPLKFIVTHVLALPMAELANIMSVRRESVSRWINGKQAAPLDELRPVLRRMCEARSLPWNDSWLFELPVCNSCIGDGKCVAGCARVVAASAAVRGGDKAGGAAMLAGMGDGRGDVHLSGPPVVLASAANEPQMNGAGNGKAGADFPSLPLQVAS